jgi:hypothetical protein
MEVSSKNWGFFNLEIDVTAPIEALAMLRQASMRSINISVKSCRCYHSLKGDFTRLVPSHPVSLLPGIGPQYAKRLREHNICTIADLSRMPSDPQGRVVRQQLLEIIRKDKGMLTEEILTDAINHAQAIMGGRNKRGVEAVAPDSNNSATNKWRRTMSPVRSVPTIQREFRLFFCCYILLFVCLFVLKIDNLCNGHCCS